MSTWTLVYEGFDSEEEGLREALCTVGNGYFATRGAAPESEASAIHYPGTYLAGGYNRLQTRIAGRVIENEDLVNMPNWLVTKFRPEGGDWFNLRSVDVLFYRQELDLQQGVLRRTIRCKDKQGRETTLVQRRFVHMGRMHLAALDTVLVAENWSGRFEVHSSLDGTVINAGVERYQQLNGKHLDPVRSEAVDDETICLLVETNQSRLRVAQAARIRVFSEQQVLEADRKLVMRPGYIGHDILVDAVEKQAIRIEKVVSFFTSRDCAVAEPALDAVDTVGSAEGFDQLLQSHVLQWGHLWNRCDIRLERSDRAQMILRLHIFHLLQTVSRNSIDLDVGTPARGWHGEAYRGHIFWDELFIFPYLNLRIPSLTRSLLLYRYRRLDRARLEARTVGLCGALYPWQSGSNGREETQHLHLNPKSGRWLPDNTHLQRHVNNTIAYNVWQYYKTTGDREFLATYGAEMILEIARFLSALTTFNQELDRYEILGVMGPDEYHDGYPDAETPGLDNNAYTNVMTVYVLRTALKAIEALAPQRRGELLQTLGVHQKELARWQDIIKKMRVAFHGEGIISQFEGYDQLREFDWQAYRNKYGNIHRLDRILEAEGDTPNRYKVSKQADVLMLFYLFSADEIQDLFALMGYDFAPESIPRNIEYYLQRSSHGSTLSNIVHSWVLARSKRQGSWELFQKALESDISDIQGGTTHEGIHLGAMAGTVDILQRCYTGLEFHDDVLYLHPSIPQGLPRLSMRIKYRGNWFDIAATQESVTIACDQCDLETTKISFQGKIYQLSPGDTLTFGLGPGGY
ncbi:glycoside hydrolase family 65 protein [Desulfobulbus alkaliphilus]|uniref:glycoside hydrolase family 65 protein n=1 Tax=Desulfobulbus alkaliphilus TaxID=869814 RepID=UPI001963E503|nr:glycoside hydrolase family 65 protein [Desulfobulbus alkaliphilus]MBM9537495.1 glycoside hydrolase family 65 protein [Desulfobulbus alkaliphilus]